MTSLLENLRSRTGSLSAGSKKELIKGVSLSTKKYRLHVNRFFCGAIVTIIASVRPSSSWLDVGGSDCTGAQAFDQKKHYQTSWNLGDAAPDIVLLIPEAPCQRSGQGQPSARLAVVTTDLPPRLPQRQRQTPPLLFELPLQPPSMPLTRRCLSLKTAAGNNTSSTCHRKKQLRVAHLFCGCRWQVSAEFAACRLVSRCEAPL